MLNDNGLMNNKISHEYEVINSIAFQSIKSYRHTEYSLKTNPNRERSQMTSSS